MAEPDVTQIVTGSGLLRIAPLGTTLPVLDQHGEYPVSWPAGWEAVGYTEDGIDLAVNPSITPIKVDEEAGPVGDVLAEEKAVISAKLAEATLQNLNRAIAASSYTNDTANSAQIVSIGSKAIQYFMVGVEAPAPGTNKARVIIMQKALSNAATSMKMQRKGKVVIPVSFEARKLSGIDLVTITDLTSTAS